MRSGSVLVVTTQADDLDAPGDGQVHELQVQEGGGGQASLALSSDVRADDAYRSQLRVAGDGARSWSLVNHVSQAVAPDRVASAPEVHLDPASEQKGGSHGLATTVALLSYLLDVPARKDRVFSAELSELDDDSLTLGAVAGVRAKTLAAGRRQVQALYFRCDEREGPDFQRQVRHYWDGTEEGRCLPIQLSERITWGNLVNLGLDTSELWRRLLLVEDPDFADSCVSFATYLLTTAFYKPAAPDEFPRGVGSMIAGLRRAGRCPADLLQRIPFADIALRCPAQHLPDVVKLAISEHADATPEQDYESWRSAGDPRVGASRISAEDALLLLDIGQDRGWLSKGDVRGLQEQISRVLPEVIAASLQQTKGGDNERVEAGVGQLVMALCRLRTRQQGILLEVANAIDRLAEQMPSLNGYSAQLRRSALSVHKVLESAGERHLTLTFAQELGCGHSSEDADERSASPRLNDLRVNYRLPDGDEYTLQSPVLLFEASRGIGSYCQRRGFRDADDTSARMPARVAYPVSILFGSAPCRLEFQLQRRAGGEDGHVGVLWVPEQIPFPPAIDAQILVRAMQWWAWGLSDAVRSGVESVIDVGCGTGYLSACAAFLLPAIRELMLVDVDKATVGTAAENLQLALRQESSGSTTFESVLSPEAVRGWSGDFGSFPDGQRFELVLCNPPYLPELHVVGSGMERATHGTALLENVVSRASTLGRYTILGLSALAWPEFDSAIRRAGHNYKSIVVLERQFVPLRVTPIMPILPEENVERAPISARAAELQFRRRTDYYDKVLKQRGLIDLDDGDLANKLRRQPSGPEGWMRALSIEDRSGLSGEAYSKVLRSLIRFSRGFRHWHEVRVVLLES